LIWWEKHRPTTLGDFIGQEHIMDEMRAVCAGKAPMQHFIFYSTEAGTGKTTLAQIIARSLGLTLHTFNASSKRTRGIDFIEEDIIFLSQAGTGEILILLDEADRLTIQAQDALKGVIEQSTCFFILTCNDLSKVSPWLQSRCQVRTFNAHTSQDMVDRLATVSNGEGINISNDHILSIVRAHKGDLRNALGALQSYSCLEPAEAERFIMRLTEGFDARRFLTLTTKEKAVAEAVKMTGAQNMRRIVREVFDFAVNSEAKPPMIQRVVEASIISERDLVNGVDESIVRWDYARMLSVGFI
jgi:replication factor C small subunit